MDLEQLGSQTARSGFRNEEDIARKFNNWKTDGEAKSWLSIMNYNLDEIERVEAITLHGYKTDVQVLVTIFLKKAVDVQNISVKLVTLTRGFNQIDKRWIDNYQAMWGFSDEIKILLKKFTGEITPANVSGLKDPRRIFLNEMHLKDQQKILAWFSDNRLLVVSDILKGREPFSAGWMLVAQKIEKNARWVLKPINIVINHFGSGPLIIKPRGSLQIGRIGMQRKGGDAGRPTANMLQFKIDPTELFDL